MDDDIGLWPDMWKGYSSACVIDEETCYMVVEEMH